jgi:hypothetical protein
MQNGENGRRSVEHCERLSWTTFSFSNLLKRFDNSSPNARYPTQTESRNTLA